MVINPNLVTNQNPVLFYYEGKAVVGYTIADGIFPPIILQYLDGTFESSLFDNYLKAAVRRHHEKLTTQAEKLTTQAESSVMSQDQYFLEMAVGIGALEKQMLIYGYDSAFMEGPRVSKAITEAVDRGVIIRAIIPDGIDAYLNSLALESSNVTVLRYPGPIREGFIIYDGKGVSYFDLGKLTPHNLEATKGVIFRERTASQKEVREAEKRFSTIESLLR